MTPTHVTMTRTHADTVRAAAERAYPEECCGLLIGRGEDAVDILAVVPTDNVAADRRGHFAIDPQIQFQWLRASRAREERIVGHYHSHPNGRATPSAEDLSMAYDGAAVWVIVAAGSGRADGVRAFVRDGERFAEIPVRLREL